jgi:phosphoesterase RecJ-like protein
MKSLSELIPLLSEPKKIVITHHNNADADALGSTLGLMHFLKKQGHTASVVSPNENPNFLSWLPGYDGIEDFETSPESVQTKLDEAELLFCLDS